MTGLLVERSAAGTSPGGSAPAHVVFLSASGQLGGAERALLDLVAGLGARGDAPRMTVVVAAPGPLEEAVRALGAAVVRVDFPERVAALGDAAVDRSARGLAGLAARLAGAVPAALAYGAQLRRTLRALAPDVVHSNGFKMHLLGAAALPGRARLVWHLHDFTRSRPLMARALRLLAPRADAAVANSRSVAEDARLLWGARPPVTPVLNAVDLGRFAPQGPAIDLDAASGLPPALPGCVRIGLVATLAHWKGHDVFLRALARLPRDVPWRGYVVSGAVYQTRGSQQSLDALRALAASLGIADRVGFPGFQPDAPAVMRALDVVVHASTQPEPFGLVIAEAMASGRAVVLSAAGGALELATRDVSALHHAPGDDAGLSRALAELLASPTRRAELGRAARAEAERRFGRDRLAAEMAAVYAALAGRR